MTVKASIILVSYENGKRSERSWDDVPATEKLLISKALTDRFMNSAGYSATDEEKGRDDG
jgi:hypothetical protein